MDGRNKGNNHEHISSAMLGVDFGLKRVGLAFYDGKHQVAVGAGWLEGLNGRALARAVRAAAEQRKTETIVIGRPPEGAREVEMVIAGADALAVSLGKMGYRIIWQDEDFTSARVLADRKKIGGKSSKPKGWVDEAAAILILQDYINNLMLNNQ
ncbi:Holliday junction resolvase RuvX [bacterium]|nr:Holliday junction resolvase RuvX [bacterium]